MVECVKGDVLENASGLEQDVCEGSAFRVCFVCTGNTCRSPMAAAVANAMAAQGALTGAPTVEAMSAGLYAAEGEPIAQNAVLALEDANIVPVSGRDYHDHTAHTLTAEEAERFDLLIGLGGGHCMELLMRFPQVAQRIVGMPTPISDPYGGSLTVYRQCLEEITRGVRELLFSSHEEGDDA